MRFAETTLVAVAAFLPATALAADVYCDGYLAVPSDIAQCADYLTSLGSQACETYGGITTVFCERGGAQVVGVGVGRVGVKTSSPCVNVAIAVGKILDKCTHDTGPPMGVRSAGQTAAEGNGDIWVHAVLKTCSSPSGEVAC